MSRCTKETPWSIMFEHKASGGATNADAWMRCTRYHERGSKRVYIESSTDGPDLTFRQARRLAEKILGWCDEHEGKPK